MSEAPRLAENVKAMEKLLAQGDLSGLSDTDRVSYYRNVCESLGLNPLTSPLEYIKLNGKLRLYARKDATDQLRKLYDVSIDKPDIQFVNGYVVVTVTAKLPSGRIDSDVGIVGEKDMGGSFANSVMKAVTKAKRRVTLSICGLGMLDETEVETIPNAQVFPASEPKQIAHSNSNGNGEPFGVKLMRRLVAVQADLVANSLCGESDLVEMIAHAGKEYGLTANILSWPATDSMGQDVGKLVKSWIDDFQQSRKLAKAAAETGREPGCDDEDGDIPTE